MRVRLPNNWRPRDYQMPAWRYLEEGGTHAELIWSRRSGKDEISLHRTAVAAFERRANYWHMLPEYAQARKAIWDAVNPHTGKRRIDEAFPVELRAKTLGDQMKIEFVNGSTWQVVGSDSYNSLVGSTPAGVVYSEWALANPAARAYLRPIFAENNGWQIFITTPRGKNHAYRTLQSARKDPQAFAQVLSAVDIGMMAPESLERERSAYIDDFGEDQGNALFEQEYLCSFEAAVLGAFYVREIARLKAEGRLTKVEYQEDIPVHTAWDIGRTDDTAIWFYQMVRGEINILECHASHTKDVPYYAELLLNKPYKYGDIWLPHDARAKTLASPRSVEMQLRDLMADKAIIKIVPSLSKQDGIQAVRKVFPQIRMDTSCEYDGLEALSQYRREWDDEKKCFKDDHVHDWTSHCFTGDTKVLTRYGTYQMIDLPLTGEVLTSCGWKRYTNPRITRTNAQLVAVEFTSGYTVRCTPDHLFKTECGWKSAESLTKHSVILSSLMKSPSISMGGYIVYGRVKNTLQGAVKRFIETFGLRRLVRFQRNAISIIKMEIQQIMRLSTLNAWMPMSILERTGNNISTADRFSSLMMPEKKPRHGINQRKAGYGIPAWQKGQSLGLVGSELKKSASIVKRCLKGLSVIADITKGFAALLAELLHIAPEDQIEMQPLVIASVRRLKEHESVWCLTVPGIEEFSLSNGAIVHNCADAFRMLAVACREDVKRKEDEPTRFATDLTLNEIIKRHGRRKQDY